MKPVFRRRRSHCEHDTRILITVCFVIFGCLGVGFGVEFAKTRRKQLGKEFAKKYSVMIVKMVFFPGGPSGYSNLDLATTIHYTGDDPLRGANDPQSRPASSVSAANLTELRTVVDAVRTLAGLGGASWKSDPAPNFGGSILLAHFKELRDNLNPALTTLGISQLPVDASLAMSQALKAAHIQDVRDKVR